MKTNMKIFITLLLLTQLDACQNKTKQDKITHLQKTTTTMNDNTPIQRYFKWQEGINAPAGYPIQVYKGGLESVSGFTGLSGIGISSNTWGSPSSGMSSGEKEVPNRINCIWVAYAEDCMYKIDCEIDYDKMIKLFNEGFTSSNRRRGRKMDTYDVITTGFAPGGVVVIWLSSGDKQVEVGRYQGEKFTVPQAEIDRLDPSEHIIFETEDRKRIMKNPKIVPPEIQEAHKNKPIPFGLWDTYREKYSWRPTFVMQREGKMDDDTGFSMFNGENETLIYETFDENKFEKRAIPKDVGFGWWDKEGQGYGAYVVFDEKEIFEAFATIYKDNKKGDAEIELKANMTNTYLVIKMKGNGKEVFITKAKIEVFESREVTRRYKKN